MEQTQTIFEELEEIKSLIFTCKEPKQMFRPIEFAELTGMTPRRVRELCNIKGFPCTRDERNIYIHREAFEWIKAREDLPQVKKY